jgi:glycosyltransferase involved in cell wall biosynthesis
MTSPGRPSTAAPRVAVDVGPMHGRRTGIGVAVAALVDQLVTRPDIEVIPYLVSRRAESGPDVVRCPLPAAMAMRSWAMFGRPRADRWLGHVDVVHGTNYTVPPFRRPIPSLVSVYDCWFLDHPDQASSDVVRAGVVLRRAVEAGAWVLSCSAATTRRVAAHFPGTTTVTIPLGPIPIPDDVAAGGALRRLTEPGHPPFVLSVGTAERRKGLGRLVAAFGALADRHPTVELVMAGGDGDDSDSIRAAIARLGPAADRVTVTGWIDDGTRAALLRAADVLAYPSLDEGFGFPLLDAMQAATPIVATAVGSIPEVAGTAGVLVADDDQVVDRLAAALHDVLTDPDRAAALVEHGRVQLERFSWSRTADEIVATYHRRS